MTTLRALLLLRQSDSRGEGDRSLSLDSQDTVLRQFAGREAWSIVDVIRESDIKGWQEVEDRPGLSEAIRRARAREYDVLLVYTIDRLFRSVRIQENVLHELEKLGVRVVSVMEPYVGEPLYRQLLGAVAEEQTRTISKHLKRAYAERARRGYHHSSNPPYGYRKRDIIVIEGEQGNEYRRPTGPLVPHEHEAPIVVELYERVDAGEPLFAITLDLVRRGIPTKRGATWTVSTMRRILQSPVNVGDVVFHGEVVARDGHAPLVSRELWERVQRRFAAHVVVRRPGRVSHWCEGLVSHGCGRRLYLYPAQGKPRRNGERTIYPTFACRTVFEPVRCVCPRRIVSAPKLEAAIRACLAADLGDRRSVSAAIAHARQVAGGAATERARRLLEERRLAVELRHDRARERYLSGRDSLAVMDEEDARYQADLAMLGRELAGLPAMPEPDRFRGIAERLRDFAPVITHASGEILRSLLEDVGHVVVDERGVSIAYGEGYAAFVPAPIVVVP